MGLGDNAVDYENRKKRQRAEKIDNFLKKCVGMGSESSYRPATSYRYATKDTDNMAGVVAAVLFFGTIIVLLILRWCGVFS